MRLQEQSRSLHLKRLTPKATVGLLKFVRPERGLGRIFYALPALGWAAL